VPQGALANPLAPNAPQTELPTINTLDRRLPASPVVPPSILYLFLVVYFELGIPLVVANLLDLKYLTRAISFKEGDDNASGRIKL
jgi:hypothetical protein